jgi:glycosyltransferase involved in cell wall biosynthesis
MTVVRVAEKLGEEHNVWVVQLRRQTATATANVQYAGPDALDRISPDAVVAVRNPICLPELRRRFPNARLLLWVHDWLFQPRTFISKLIRRYLVIRGARLLTRTKTVVIAVSSAHREHLQGLIHGHFPANLFGRGVKSLYIYNPVCVASDDSEAQVDIDKLIYFSAPFKGLHVVLPVFRKVSQFFPDMKLHVAMPPYSSLSPEMQEAVRAPNVVDLGRLDQPTVLNHVRTSLCCFYPADVWPESFGLVFGESNAVGTPVLAHPFGSAPEVLTEEQLCDAHDLDEIVKRLRRWREPGKRPKVQLRPEFMIDHVANRWNEVLFGP